MALHVLHVGLHFGTFPSAKQRREMLKFEVMRTKIIFLLFSLGDYQGRLCTIFLLDSWHALQAKRVATI